jgi:hypothetical protein
MAIWGGIGQSSVWPTTKEWIWYAAMVVKPSLMVSRGLNISTAESRMGEAQTLARGVPGDRQLRTFCSFWKDLLGDNRIVAALSTPRREHCRFVPPDIRHQA